MLVMIKTSLCFELLRGPVLLHRSVSSNTRLYTELIEKLLNMLCLCVRLQLHVALFKGGDSGSLLLTGVTILGVLCTALEPSAQEVVESATKCSKGWNTPMRTS